MMFWSVKNLRFENLAYFFSRIFSAAKHTLNFLILGTFLYCWPFVRPVLQLLKSAQMQHGLRHGDYTRYR